VALDRVRRLEFGTGLGPGEQLTERALAAGRLTVGGPGNPVPEAMRTPGFWYQQRVVTRDPFLLTGDSNLVDLRFGIQYRVRDPVQFLFGAADPEALIASAAVAGLRAVVATQGIDALYTIARESTQVETRRQVQATLDRHRAGIELLGLQLLYVHPPEEVHDAFRDVASAQEDKLRTINRAGAFAVEKVNQAKAEAGAEIQAGMAFELERKLRAQGAAAAFALQAQSYAAAPDLTLFRLQIEALESALAGVRKVVRPGAAELGALDVWLLRPPPAGGPN
jgi:HflK protein